MEENQKICCSVTSCKYNEDGKQVCALKEIMVTPIEGCNTCKADESMCSSYKSKR